MPSEPLRRRIVEPVVAAQANAQALVQEDLRLRRLVLDADLAHGGLRRVRAERALDQVARRRRAALTLRRPNDSAGSSTPAGRRCRSGRRPVARARSAARSRGRGRARRARATRDSRAVGRLAVGRPARGTGAAIRCRRHRPRRRSLPAPARRPARPAGGGQQAAAAREAAKRRIRARGGMKRLMPTLRSASATRASARIAGAGERSSATGGRTRPTRFPSAGGFGGRTVEPRARALPTKPTCRRQGTRMTEPGDLGAGGARARAALARRGRSVARPPRRPAPRWCRFPVGCRPAASRSASWRGCARC